MTTEDIKDLIAELKELKLRELQVIESLERAVREQEQNNNNSTTSVTSGITSPSPFARAVATSKPSKNTKVINQYQAGDRVVITNNITRPLNRTANKGDRTAVVTHVVGSRVHIRTSNNSKTWRAPQNLRYRTNDE
jgi:hypothetical protein